MIGSTSRLDPQTDRHARAIRWLTHRRMPLILMGLATLLLLPSLWAGWIADDYHLRFRFTASERLPQVVDGSANPLLDLFTFADGDPQQNQRLMDLGLWPWWMLPELKASFFRPITAATHWLDFRLWPNHAILMHAQSILWYAALVGAVCMLYRRLMGAAWVVGLAALLFTIDDAHAIPAAWMANRNALLATLFGVLAIVCHDRWRRERWRSGALMAPLLLAMSLLSKESGVATCAYLLAYAVYLDRGSWGLRLLSLLPYGLVVATWRIAWTQMGYGIWGINIYVDPLTEPLRYLGAVVERFPIYLLGQWLLPPSEVYLPCIDLGILSYFWAFAIAAVALMALIIVRHLPWDAGTRFWCAGMLLAVLPVCSAFPGDRVLCFVGLGAFPLLATCLQSIFASRRIGTRLARLLGKVLVGVHLVFAPLTLVVRAAMPLGPSSLIESLQVHVPLGDEVAQQRVVIVTAPVPLLAGYLPERRAIDGLPVPAHTTVLSPSQRRPVVVHRPDQYALVIKPPNGFMALSFDRLARGLHHPMAIGEQVALTGMTALVLSVTDDGRPAEVSFTFDVPLEDASLRWLRWTEHGFAPFDPPPVGATIELSSREDQ